MRDVYFRPKSMRGFTEDGKQLICHSEEVKKNPTKPKKTQQVSNKEIGKLRISSLKQTFLLVYIEDENLKLQQSVSFCVQ